MQTLYTKKGRRESERGKDKKEKETPLARSNMRSQETELVSSKEKKTKQPVSTR